MRHYLPIIIVFLAACGGVDCKFNVQGLCVDPGEYPFNETLLSQAIDIENSILQDQFQNIDLASMFSQHDVTLRYVEEIPESWSSGRKLRGVTKESDILIKFSFDSCTDNYYVPTHEFLHVFANFVLQASAENNFNHTVDNLFYDEQRITVEGNVLGQLIPLLGQEGCHVINN